MKQNNTLIQEETTQLDSYKALVHKKVDDLRENEAKKIYKFMSHYFTEEQGVGAKENE